MDFVIIGNSWDAKGSNPTSKHQIALSLAAQGHKVLWVDGAGMRRPSLSSGGDRAKIGAKLRSARAPVKEVETGIWRVSPLILPLPSSGLARSINDILYKRAIRRGMGAAGMKDPVLINFLPTIPGVVKAWSREHGVGRKGEGTKHTVQVSGFRSQVCLSIYYCVDRWDQFGTYDSRLMEELDAQCCRNADIVIASAQDLFDRCKRHNPNTHLIPHGVDHAHFARTIRMGIQQEGREGSGSEGIAIKSPPSGEGASRTSCEENPRKIGFFGLISEWVDQELLIKLSGLENCEVVLAGKADVDTQKLKDAANIQMPGPVPYNELPDLIATFDVGIIPFKVNELTRAVNPIKLREMLAAGCPVVATDLPEILKVAAEMPEGAVSSAEDSREFVKLVKAQLARKLTADDRKAISDSVKDQDWSVKVDEIIELL